MNGLQGLARARPWPSAMPWPRPGTVPEVMICPPAAILAAARRRCTRVAARRRRPGLPRRALRGPHRRYFGRNDCRCWRFGRDRRPFRAPLRSWRAGSHCAQQGRGGARAGLTAIVCVGETAGQRQAGMAVEVVQPPARGLAAGKRHRSQHSSRLRARLGYRHRADPTQPDVSSDPRRHPRSPGCALRAGGPRHAHSLWGLA